MFKSPTPVHARCPPLPQMRDGGNLLTRSGFSLPTVDCDTFVLKYPVGPPTPTASTGEEEGEAGRSPGEGGSSSNSSSSSSGDGISSSSSSGSISSGSSLGGAEPADVPVGPEALVAHLRVSG